MQLARKLVSGVQTYKWRPLALCWHRTAQDDICIQDGVPQQCFITDEVEPARLLLGSAMVNMLQCTYWPSEPKYNWDNSLPCHGD
jgi:hypothetical protein